MFFEKKRHNL